MRAFLDRTDARSLTSQLRFGRWFGFYGRALCPNCGGSKHNLPLSISQGEKGVLLHCFRGCSFSDVARALGVDVNAGPMDPAAAQRLKEQAEANKLKRERQARDLWERTEPIAGTLAEKYLDSRGITFELSPNLRFLSDCWHGPTAHRWPAMVALIEGGEGFAVHRTYLAKDGSGKAPLDQTKMMLGPARGGAVSLSEHPGPLVVAEGIETALSLPGGPITSPCALWAALSTSGMKSLALPLEPHDLIIAPDPDPPGIEAAHDLGTRAHRLGWRVQMLTPPESGDWNDRLNEEKSNG